MQTFAPMAINQVANRPLPGRQLDTWNLVMNGSEVREIPNAAAVKGESLTWKLAMWGSFRDGKLLARLAKNFETLEKFAGKNGLTMAQGLELRDDPIGLPAKKQGDCLWVNSVVDSGPAANAGIKPGDKILRINEHDVADLTEEEAIRLLHGSEGGTLRVPVKRNGPPGSAALELEFSGDKLEHHPELEGEWDLSLGRLKVCGRIADFPEHVLGRIPASRCWVRQGRTALPMSVSQPPHLLTDVGRRFAVYRNDFVAVPARQIGIAGASLEDEPLLRALSLFLTSDFCLYHQFFAATQWGVEHSIATLRVLRLLPVPDLSLLAVEWASVHAKIVERTPPGEAISGKDQDLINSLVWKALGLRRDEQYLVEAFVRTQMRMVQGKVAKDALNAPSETETEEYLTTLRDQLDDFMTDDSEPASNHLTALCDGQTAMIEIILREGKPVEPVVLKAGAPAAAELEKARSSKLKKHRQWIYFDRNLILQSSGRLYFFKPLNRIQWTRRQAILDADELIAEAYSSASD